MKKNIKVFYPRPKLGLYPRGVNEQARRVLDAELDPAIDFIMAEEMPEIADYDILVAGRPTVEQLTASPNLHAVVIPWAGVSEETLKLMLEYPDLSLHNLHHNASATAETALMLLLTAAKLIIPIEGRFREHDWTTRYGPSTAVGLYEKTILILGFGHVGRHIARACVGMGMKILAVRRDTAAAIPGEIRAEVHPPDDLHTALPRANVLMITLPLTNETEGMIGEEEIHLLPPNAILVNVGRGPVVDQKALYDALKEGRLHSAGIDVWYNYPQDEESRTHTPPADFPFHELENVVMSPHRGGGAMNVEILRMGHLARLLNAAAKGEPLPNKIDLNRGY
jgi:phosphoglycerate dehydrogenase-like enzyme